MGKASGFLLVCLGLGLAAYVALPAHTPPVAGTDDFDFRLNQSVLSKSEPSHPSTSVPAPPANVVQSQAPIRFGAEAASAVASAPAVVTVAPTNRPRLAINAAPNASAPTTDRTQLARELQKELRRVGCYDGEINGGWTTSTKRAMKTFTERVNASLPVEEPDFVLLSLVQGQADKTCGRPCPAGEAAADGGRCVPAAVATTPRKAAHNPGPGPTRDTPQPAIGWSTATTPSATAPLEGRMGLAGPDDEAPKMGLTAPQGGSAAAVPRSSVAGAGYAAPMPEARSATAADRSPSRRFDAQSFFRRLDKQSAN
jgi:hypothetical protein